MKKIQLLFWAILLPFILLAQTPQLHVEGETRIDPLAGNGNRPVYADGQGNLIIGSLYGGTSISVDNYADFKSLTPADSMIVLLEGFYTSGDGGGGLFFYNPLSTESDDIGTVVKPNSISGAGRWIRLHQDEMNVKWFGAKGDRLNDDTTPIQAAINAIKNNPTGAASVAGTIIFPTGDYRITSTIEIIDNMQNSNRRDIRLLGSANGSAEPLGTILYYDSPNDAPILEIRSRNCLIEGLSFRVSQSSTITTAILIDSPVNGPRATHNSFKNIHIGGDRNLPPQYFFGTIKNGVTIGDDIPLNKELMKFYDCAFQDLEEAGFFIESADGQSKQHSLYNCSFFNSKYGIRTISGSFQTYSCSFGSLDTAIYINQLTDNIVINDTDSEVCDAFLITQGNSNGFWPVSITGGRFAVLPTVANPYISFYHSGPLTIQNCVFEPQYNANFRIEWGTPDGPSGEVSSVLNSFGNGFPNDNPYAPDAMNNWRLNAIGNIGYREVNVGGAVVDSPVTLVDEFRANAIGYGNLNLTTLSGISSTSTPAKNVRGRFRLEGTVTSVTITFDEPEIDNDYYLSITQVEMIGTPIGQGGMGTVRNVTKTTTGFTAEFYETLGFGTEGYFDWILVR